jgi:hypothetical protein
LEVSLDLADGISSGGRIVHQLDTQATISDSQRESCCLELPRLRGMEEK